MPHLEALEIARLDIPSAQILDLGFGRALAQPLDHGCDCLSLALDMAFDAPVRAVADPTRDSEILGLPSRPCPVEDSLHSPVDPDVASDSHESSAKAGA